MREAMMTTLGKSLVLILPVLTRWTSHYLSVRRLLQVERALRIVVWQSRDRLIVAAGKLPEAKRKAEEDDLQQNGLPRAFTGRQVQYGRRARKAHNFKKLKQGVTAM